ncbi:MAG: MBL fold metallo-hydrolase, partial [Acinetobacter sp.]
MTNMKSVLISLGLVSTTFSSAFALTPPAPIPQQKQVSGYYQYQAGDIQITALLDGT